MAGRDRTPARRFSLAEASGLVLAGVSLGTALAGGILAAAMARTVVTPPRGRVQDIRILAVDRGAGTVTLNATADAVLDGDYSLWFSADTGHARLGPVTARGPGWVTRTLIAVDFGVIDSAVRGRLSGWLYLGPWDLGLSYTDVVVDTPLGDAPAWLIPSAEPTGRWVIQVHGRAVRRQEALRAVPAFRDAGYTSLLVSYRTDGDAPDDPSGRYGLGDTEWQDVDAALGYAVAHGATSVVLMGWSMGGAIVLQTLLRSPLAAIVTGLVLESPVIDWSNVIDFQGSVRRLPALISRGALRLMGARWAGPLTGLRVPIDFTRLDLLARADELEVPILLLHSDDDGFIPATGSRRLAELRPDIVTFVPYHRARHTKLWNIDPARFDRTVTNWLTGLPAWPRGASLGSGGDALADLPLGAGEERAHAPDPEG